MLQVRVFAVTDETAVGQRGIRRFKIQFVVRIDLFLHVEVEAVGVIAFVGDARYHAEIGGIQPAEAVAQVLARRAVQAEAITGFFLPTVGGGPQAGNNGNRLGAQRFVVVDVPLVTEQRVDGLMQADITQ
ncbi:hypothetical protein D3C81_1057910 [compost metagenome]